MHDMPEPFRQLGADQLRATGLGAAKSASTRQLVGDQSLRHAHWGVGERDGWLVKDPWFRVPFALAVVAMLAALYAIFIYAPTERVMGDVQRIFYVHVSLAWLSYLAFFVVFVCSIVYLWRRDERWDAVARASAEIGVALTTLFIMSGALWGRPVWGTWWTWDARLTTTAILWFIYVAYLMLRAYVPEVPRAARYAAVLGIVGFLDVPIIHMSVVWWRTLHPEPTVARLEGTPLLPPEMLATLVVTSVAFGLLYLALMIVRVRLERLKDEVRYLQQALSLRGE
jgi:heme exporter protein C